MIRKRNQWLIIIPSDCLEKQSVKKPHIHRCFTQLRQYFAQDWQLYHIKYNDDGKDNKGSIEEIKIKAQDIINTHPCSKHKSH